jgi:uncharacterized protein (TIGR03435 family)
MKPALLLLLSCVALAQTPGFELADVHVSKPGATPTGAPFPGGGFELHGFTIVDLIRFAYGVDDDMVVGGPGWLGTERFDVIAKAPRGTSDDKARVMLRDLLADRFKLTYHIENKPRPAFVMTVAKKSVLKPGDGSEDGECEPKVDQPWITFVCKNLTMAAFAERIHQWAGAYVTHPVVDQTGLKGGYDFTLHWVGRGALETTPDAISAFDAVEKQMGLKLVAGTQPLPAMVIDSVEKTPTPNAPGVTEKLPDTPTEFEVADVKPSRPDEKTNLRFQPNGRLDAQGVPLKLLLQFAYDTFDENGFVGAPKWWDSEHFDIVAKASRAVPVDALRVMLKKLLTDRFGLVVHMEQQPIQVYALTAGKHPKLEQATGNERTGCNRSIDNGMLFLTCKNTTMVKFAEEIHQAAGGYFNHALVDLTELTGAYNFTLSWTPKQNIPGAAPPPSAPAAAAATGSTAVASDPGGITVFEAIDRQLGLKVETQKRPMPVVVIDHLNQKPTEN